MSQKYIVLIRFGISVTQACKNSLLSKLSIIKGYGGKIVGVSDEIEVIEGSWPRNLGLALLEFDDEEGAYWFQKATPDINQHDWLGGVEIIAVQCRTQVAHGKDWFQIMDMAVTDRNAYMVDYVPGHQEIARKAGATLAVVDCKESKKYRVSQWDPKQLVIHQWKSREQFIDWYNSSENKDWKELRQRISCSDMILAEFTPLHGHTC